MRSLDVDREGQEVPSRRLPTVAVLRTIVVALTDDDGAGGPAWHILPGLEGDLRTGDLY